MKASSGVKNYLLASRELGKHMQGNIDMYITKDRLNKVSFLRQLDPMFKSLLCRQNPLELVFNTISTFDGQDQITGNFTLPNLNNKILYHLMLQIKKRKIQVNKLKLKIKKLKLIQIWRKFLIRYLKYLIIVLLKKIKIKENYMLVQT